MEFTCKDAEAEAEAALMRVALFSKANTGPEPAILDWYGHCMRLSVNKLGGLGAFLK